MSHQTSFDFLSLNNLFVISKCRYTKRKKSINEPRSSDIFAKQQQWGPGAGGRRHRPLKKVNLGCFEIALMRAIESRLNRSDRMISSRDIMGVGVRPPPSPLSASPTGIGLSAARVKPPFMVAAKRFKNGIRANKCQHL